jgi:hypothetical protein
VLITVLKATPTIALNAGPFDYDAVPHAATGIATGVGGAPVAGTFGFTYTPGGSAPPVNAATYSVTAIFTSTDLNYSGASGTAVLTIVPGCLITLGDSGGHRVWDRAGATQLNMTADTAGTYMYTPPAGTVLSAKNSHVLFATFFPADPNYRAFTKTVLINVLRALPAITWSTPAQFIDGTPLSATQLNATANVPGSFAYTPAGGTVLAAGTRTLSVTFTPNDAANYTVATKSVSSSSKVFPVSRSAPRL